jgi:hypothetical protein
MFLLMFVVFSDDVAGRQRPLPAGLRRRALHRLPIVYVLFFSSRKERPRLTWHLLPTPGRNGALQQTD